MRSFLKENISIILAFTLPVAFIAIIALSTYLPDKLFSTEYNFIYVACTNGNDYYSSQNCGEQMQRKYSVYEGKLLINDSNREDDLDYDIRIFLHNTKTNESREITEQEAQSYTLNPLLTSPDGVTISNHYEAYSTGGFLFFDFSEPTHGYYLTKGNQRSKLNIITGNRYYYRDNFKFLGWILPNE